jgi:hypothetical protein
MAASETNPRGGAAVGSPSSVKNDAGHHEEDSKPPFVVTSSSALVAPDPDQEVAQEEGTHYQLMCFVSWDVG